MIREEAESIFAIPEEDDDFMIFTYADAIGDLNDLLKEFDNLKPEPNDKTTTATEHVFIWNHDEHDFDTMIIPATDERNVENLKVRAAHNAFRSLRMYSCLLTPEEVQDLNLQLKYNPVTAFKRLEKRSVLSVA